MARRFGALWAAFVMAFAGVTAASAAGAQASATGVRSADAPAAGGVVAIRPTRVLDTRVGFGAPAGTRPDGSVTTVSILGRGGVPSSGVGAVAITVTATAASAPGYVVAFGSGAAPSTSTVNYLPGRTVSNLAIVPVDASGSIRLATHGGTVQIIGDVSGWVASGPATAPGSFVPLTPSRLLDTRTGNGAPAVRVTGPAAVTLQVAGRGGVPVGASAAFLNVTVVKPTKAGFVAVTANSSKPTTSSVNFTTGDVVANLVSAPLSASGQAYLHVATGVTVDLVADVEGYVTGGSPGADVGSVVPIAPTRLFDTRPDALEAGGVLTVSTVTSSSAGLNVGAALLNVTATGASAPGFVVVGAEGGGTPATSPLSLRVGVASATLVLAPVDASGQVRLTVSGTASTSLVVDVVGYVLGDPTTASNPPPVTDLATSGSPTLTWTFPASTAAVGVVVRRSPGATPPASPFAGRQVMRTSSPTTSFTDSTASPGGIYSYAVFTVDAAGGYSEAATATSLTPRPGPSWVVNQPGVPRQGGPTSVSCPTATFCMAVDQTGHALTWNGTTWSTPQSVFPAYPEASTFTEVSCSSTTFCLAVASGHGYAVWSGGTWTVRPSGEGGGFWSRVDCASATSCLLGDDEGPAHLGRWNGSAVVAVSGGPVLDEVAAIACPSSSGCVLVGTKGTTSYAIRQTATGWSSHALAGHDVHMAPQLDLSCPTTSFCMVTDGETNKVWRLNGSTWSAGAEASDPSGQTVRGGRVSCASATSCDVVSVSGSGHWNGTSWSVQDWAPPYIAARLAIDCSSTVCLTVDTSGRYRKRGSGAWSAPAVFDLTTTGPIDVACDSASSCWVTDESGAVMHWNGTSWGGLSALLVNGAAVDCPAPGVCLGVDAVNGTSRALKSGSWAAPVTFGRANSLMGLACLSATRCIALHSLVGEYYVWNGSTWTSPLALPAGFAPETIQCPTSSWCLATDPTANTWATWNGSTWSGRHTMPLGTGPVESLSCTSATFCMGWDLGGGYTTFDGSRWSAKQSLPPGQIRILGCASATQCYAVDDTAFFEYQGEVLLSWGGRDWAPTSTNLDFQALRLDCAAGRCMIVGGTESAWTS